MKASSILQTLILLLCGALGGCALPGRMLRGYAEAAPAELDLLEDGGAYVHAAPHLRGQVRFAFDGFGSLSTDGLSRSAIPWKLLVATLALDRSQRTGEPLSREVAASTLRDHGFLTPNRIVNWVGEQPRLERPLGVVGGVAERGFPSVAIEIAGFGCATCHAGPVFGPDGRPTGDAWLGIPNASMDLSSFGRTVTHALERQLPEPDALLRAVATLYPDVSERELSIMRKHVLPAATARLGEQLADRGHEPMFEHGGPGLMNGVAGLRHSLDLLHPDARSTEVAWMSPPALADVTLRKSLLVDATYAPAGSDRFGKRTRADIEAEGLDSFAEMMTLFVLTTFDVEPEAARNEVDDVREVVAFLDRLDAPPFPGPVDAALARRGETAYREACAGCHGTYSGEAGDLHLSAHPNRLVPQDRMGTDPARWVAADTTVLAALAGLGWEEQITTASFGGYVAPDLTGVWATAPYLHNGSVPTLWHLLNAEKRPVRFMVGGHELDYELMGIRGVVDDSGDYVYPEGYEPWARPSLYDTRRPGRSNVGHEFPGLTPEDRRAILEYLKLL